MERLVEGFVLRQRRKHDRREFLGDGGASNGFAFALLPALELGLHFREVLHGANRGMVKGHLEIAVGTFEAPRDHAA